METLPCHRLGPCEHGFGTRQPGPVPMAFQHSPAPLDGIVLAVIGWIVDQLDGYADGIDEFHHPFQKLGARAAALRTVVGFDPDEFCLFPFPGSNPLPPRMERIDYKIAGFVGTAEGYLQLPGVLVHDSEGNIFFLTSLVVVAGLVVAPGLSFPRVVADIDRGLAVHAHSLDVDGRRCDQLLRFLDVFEDGVGFGNFF